MLRSRLINAAIFLGILAPPILLGIFRYREVKREMTHLLFSRMQSIADLSATTLKERFDRFKDVGLSFATRVRFREVVSQGKWGEAIKILEGIPKDFPFVERLFLTDLSGTLMADTPSRPGVIGKNFAYRDWYQGVSRNWQPFLSEAYERAAEPRHHVVAVALPVRSPDKGDEDKGSQAVTGILVLQIRLDTLLSWANTIEVGPAGFVSFVDQNGHWAVHPKWTPGGELKDISGWPIIQRASQGEKGVGVFPDPMEAVDYVIAYESVPHYGWTVLVQQPAGEAFAARTQSLRSIVFAYGLSTLLSLVLAWFVVRAATHKSLAKKKLLESEEKNRLVIETAHDAFVGMDHDGRITDWNRQAELTFGWTKAEAVGRPLAETIIPPALREAHRKGLKRYLASGEGPVLNKRIEIEALRRDGSEFSVELTIWPVQYGDQFRFNAFVHDISDRKKVDNMKNEFISMVSHELRTPLTSIRGSLGLIAGGLTGELPEKAGKFVDIAVNNCERLIRLINDILDIEKIESGRMDYRRKPVALASLLIQTIEANQAYAEQSKTRFAIEGDLPQVWVNVDGDRLAQVIVNLLSNAAKFSPENEPVTVRMVQRDGSVRLSVSDRGPGIPQEFQGKIFEKFAQADASNTRRKGGTGLGLSISKAIIESFEGTIGFETGPGGTTFRPDLILLDVMMPEMDGPATFRAFRRIPETATTPVIFLTSKVQANEIASYRALGAIDVLCKPFDPVTLAVVIRRIWEAAEKRR